MAENGSKTKGKGCLIALGAVGVLFVVLALAVTFVLHKAKNVVEGLAEGVGTSPKMVERIESLNESYAFQIPEDNHITEAQLQRFIDVKKEFAEEVRGHKAEFEALDKKASEKKAGFKEAMEGFKLLGKIRREFLDSLDKHRMSPKEYAYITGQVYSSYLASAYKQTAKESSEGIAEMRESYQAHREEIEKKLQDPELTEEMRESLKQTLKTYKQTLLQAESGVRGLEKQAEQVPAENLRLFEKYRPQLEELNTWGFELWGLSLVGAGLE